MNRAFQATVASVTAIGWTIAPAGAQSARDSAGIQIVTSDRPAWRGTQALRLGPSPVLVIGDRPGERYELSRVNGALRLANGSVVVADGGSLELRFFDSTGTFLKSAGRSGDGPGEFRRFEGLTRLAGDTIVVIGRAGVSLFTPSGTFVRSLPNPPHIPPPFGRVLALFPGGSRIMMAGTRPMPRGRGEWWVDSMAVLLVDGNNATVRDLGKLAAFQLVMDEGLSQPWFGPVASWAATSRALYYGFPSEYSIRGYLADGRLTRIIRRRWIAQRVTDADKDEHTLEWGKRWIKSSGAEAANERSDHRDDPYASTVPAFSQLIVDGAGRLWVRDAHLADAAWAGQLNTLPVVASAWSVFDAGGRWLSDVTMPARFLPSDIGRDFVLGVARDADDVETVVVYRLVGGGRTP